MKVFLVLSMMIAVALAHPEHYDSKFDNFDVKALVQNPTLLHSYAVCLLDKGSCTPEGSDFKKILPDAVATSCRKCSPKQRILVRTVVRALKEKMPEEWDELARHYDPIGKFSDSFGKFLASDH